MKTSLMKTGVCGLATLFGAFACSGTNLNDVGDLNGGSGGIPGANTAGDANSVGGANAGGANAGGANNAGGSDGRGAIAGAGPIGIAGSLVVDPQGGAGGQPDGMPLVCPGCSVVNAGGDVRGIAANDQDVFWVDYGAKDALGNQGPGRLLTRGLEGGAISVLADSLPGPESVSLTSLYAYIAVDARTEPDHAFGVMRVPLAGGDAQDIQAPMSDSYYDYWIFAAAPGYEYWNWNGAAYRVAESGDATVETVIPPRGIEQILIDGTLLYFQDADGIWTMPLAGGDPTEISSMQGVGVLGVNGDYLYALETPVHSFETGTYLTRMPKSGGAWTRVLSSSENQWSQIAFDGDSYFIDESTDSQRRIVQGSLTTPTQQTTLASQAFSQATGAWSWQAWTLSRVGVFLASSDGLYLTPTVTP